MNIFKIAEKIEAVNNQQIDSLFRIVDERARQDGKWGQQNHSIEKWMPILMEEVGELSEAVNETIFNNGPEAQKKGGYDNLMKEASHVAAVAVGFMECLQRKYEAEERRMAEEKAETEALQEQRFRVLKKVRLQQTIERLEQQLHELEYEIKQGPDPYKEKGYINLAEVSKELKGKAIETEPRIMPKADRSTINVE